MSKGNTQISLQRRKGQQARKDAQLQQTQHIHKKDKILLGRRPLKHISADAGRAVPQGLVALLLG